MHLAVRDGAVALDRVAVMGILNVTPDSFSDGGLWNDTERAVAHAREMVAAGAAIVDVGGESTRPGAIPVPLEEEMARVIPVVERIAPEMTVSIDTRKSEVARAALEAGAHIVNDTLGEEAEPSLWDEAARAGAAIIAMHSRGTPDTMRTLTDYGDVVDAVCGHLATTARRIEERGVRRDAIGIDPGIGFAKTPAQNLELLRRLDQVVALGYPVLAGTSRKSFIGATLELPEDRRLEGTAATVTWAVAKGARIVRVHDVVEMVRVVRMTEAIMSSGTS